MRIALLSTCAVSVPPRAYGGTELITAELAKCLVALGHDVTVYATGDSSPAGTLLYRFPRPVWPPDDLAELRHAAFAWSHIASVTDRPFDVVHTHQAPSIAFAAMFCVPTVLTLHHEREASLLDFYLDFPDVRYVAISRRQSDLVPEMRVSDVVHHGLDPSLFELGEGGDGCVFIGRLAEEKGAHRAIDAALAAGVRLSIGGQPHWKDQAYFDREIRPRLDRAGAAIDWRGEVSHEPKVQLLRGARALLFPVEWEEPFGLVMIESMLVGTPVIAFDRGSVPEVVEEGVTGFVVRDAAQMADRLRTLDAFDRKRCRERAQERWSSMRMARDYVRVYESVIRNRQRIPQRMWGVGAAEGAPRPSKLPTEPQLGEHVFGRAGARG